MESRSVFVSVSCPACRVCEAVRKSSWVATAGGTTESCSYSGAPRRLVS